MSNSLTSKPKNSIKSGDLFRLGRHRLLCGSATDPEAVKRLVGSEKINLLVCDVPYGILYAQSKAGFSKIKVNKEIINDDLTSETDYSKFTYDWLSAITPHLCRKNAAYIFNSDKMIFALREGMQQAGFTFSQLLIWVKNHSVIGRKDYLPQHELIAYGWHGTHQFMKAQDRSVIFCPKPNKSPYHPTQKPISLLRRLILNSTKLNEVVYDGFGGGGSTLLACEDTRRKCLMMEIDLDYCSTVIARFERTTNIKAEKI